MSFPPQVFLIGTQKGGTTYLANLLGQHPEICLAEPKEPDFFTQHWDSGISWYQERFKHCEAPLLLDASPSYSAAPLPCFMGNSSAPSRMAGVPGRIKSVSPNAKFIYLLREPVKRTYSSYWHNVRGGYENLPFREAIDQNSYYLRMGHYYDQIQLYLEFFKPEAFMFLLFEEFILDPQGTTNKCYRFLDLEEFNDFSLDKGKNQSFGYSPFLNRLNQGLSSFGGLNRLVKSIKPMLPKSAIKPLSKILTKKIPPISIQDKNYLSDYFKDKNALLTDRLGISLERWKED